MKTRNKALIAAALLLLSFAAGYITRKVTCKPVVDGVQRDTVTVMKPVEFTDPEPDEVVPAPPVTVTASEISFSADSSEVEIPAETRTYRDTLADGTSYEAVVSGVQAVLQDLKLQYPSTTITNTVTVTRPYEGWKLSLTSDNAVIRTDDWGLTSLTALELSYTTGPFQAGLQGGLLIEKPFRSGGVEMNPYLGGRITIDLFKLGR